MQQLSEQYSGTGGQRDVLNISPNRKTENPSLNYNSTGAVSIANISMWPEAALTILCLRFGIFAEGPPLSCEDCYSSWFPVSQESSLCPEAEEGRSPR